MPRKIYPTLIVILIIAVGALWFRISINDRLDAAAAEMQQARTRMEPVVGKVTDTVTTLEYDLVQAQARGDTERAMKAARALVQSRHMQAHVQRVIAVCDEALSMTRDLRFSLFSPSRIAEFNRGLSARNARIRELGDVPPPLTEAQIQQQADQLVSATKTLR